MKQMIPLRRHLMNPALVLCLTCLLAGPLLAAESAGEMKLQKAREALTGEPKDPIQAKRLLLDIVEHNKATLDSMSLCYVYVYLGYIEDRAGNRNHAIPWYQKAIELKDTDRVRECAEYGLEKPLTWIRHLDEATTPPPGTTAGKISLATAPPVVVRTVPLAGATDVNPALTEIRVTYSKPMQDGSWSWSTWGEENYPKTTGNPRYLSDDRTCVLPVTLKPGRFYALWLNTDKYRNFKDANGKPAVPYLLTFRTAGDAEKSDAAAGDQFFQKQLALAQAGNFWAKYKLWEAFATGSHAVTANPAEADKWLAELVKGAYRAKFEPVSGFNPRTPRELLDEFSEHCQLYSGKDRLGGASFFRTTKQGDKLIGFFLTETPEEFKAAIAKDPRLKLIAIEAVTPEMFLAHQASPQESF